MHRKSDEKFILAIIMALAIASPAPAQSGSATNGLQYTIENNSSVTITRYAERAQTLVIPGEIEGLPVTKIAEGAFNLTAGLTSITIPSSVTYIGEGVFAYNSRLTSINVNDRNTVYSSANGVLFDKSRHTLIHYPKAKRGSTYALPASVTSIREGAFTGNTSLMGIIADNRNPAYASVNGVLFDKNIQTLVHYPEGRSSFDQSLGLNQYQKSMQESIYEIPSSVTSIGNSAFRNTRLVRITIPASVTSIGNRAFYGNRLSAIIVDSGNPAYASVNGVLYDKSIQTLICYPGYGQLNTYTIPSSVKSIGNYAFAYSRNLTSVTIPSSVTSIGDSAFIGTVLPSITIPPSVTSIGDSAFAFNSALTNVTISRRTRVGNAAFPPNAAISYSN